MGANRNRRDRLAGQLRAVIAECLLFEAKDPGLRELDITDVIVSGDLGHAKVYYYARGDASDLEKIERALSRAQGFIRRRVGQEIRARVTPELVFYYDDSIERGAQMERILSEVRERDASFALEYRGEKNLLSDFPDPQEDDQEIEVSSVSPHYGEEE